MTGRITNAVMAEKITNLEKGLHEKLDNHEKNINDKLDNLKEDFTSFKKDFKPQIQQNTDFRKKVENIWVMVIGLATIIGGVITHIAKTIWDKIVGG